MRSFTHLPFVAVPDCIFQATHRLSTSSSFAVLVGLLRHSNRTYKPVWPSTGCLAKELNLSERTVRRSLEDLRGNNFIRIEERRGTSSIFHFTFDEIPEVAAQLEAAPKHKVAPADIPGMSGTFVNNPGQFVPPPRSNRPTNQMNEPDGLNQTLRLKHQPPQQWVEQQKTTPAMQEAAAEAEALPGTDAQRKYLLRHGFTESSLEQILRQHPCVKLSRVIERLDQAKASQVLIRSYGGWLKRVIADPEFSQADPSNLAYVEPRVDPRILDPNYKAPWEIQKASDDLKFQKQEDAFKAWRYDPNIDSEISELCTGKGTMLYHHYRIHTPIMIKHLTIQHIIDQQYRKYWDDRIDPSRPPGLRLSR